MAVTRWGKHWLIVKFKTQRRLLGKSFEYGWILIGGVVGVTDALHNHTVRRHNQVIFILQQAVIPSQLAS